MSRFMLETSGPFLDGWLAFVFGLPSNPAASPAWREGWTTALETGQASLLMRALGAEIERGSIRVTYDAGGPCPQCGNSGLVLERRGASSLTTRPCTCPVGQTPR